MDTRSFTIDSCVRGYHIYKDTWNPVFGELLTCQLEFGNIHDPYAVTVLSASATVVGHIPRNISAICYLFIRRTGTGTIVGQVTGTRRYSSDLVQGGLEIPCRYTFRGNDKGRLDKVRSLVEKAPTLAILEPPVSSVSSSPDQPPPCKKAKKIVDLNEENGTKEEASDQTWLSLLAGCFLTLTDKQSLVSGKQLNNRHMNFSQQLLLLQFPETKGLIYTLLQSKEPKSKINQGIQIIHDRGNHWLLASTLNSSTGTKVNIYDSSYASVSEETKSVIKNLFQLGINSDFSLVLTQKQIGSTDCGLFTIAVATALLFKRDESELLFNQGEMRKHLLSCLERKYLSPFP